MLFEIRNYHIEPTKFEAYKKWSATLAAPYLKRKMDVVGIWVNNEMAPEYGGSLPHDKGIRPANVTLIIRFQDKAQRDKATEERQSDPEWQAILSAVPGGRESFLRTEVKFATEI